MTGASDKSDRAVVNGAGQAVSAVPASVPSARTRIAEPFSVAGYTIESRWIADAIDMLANLPEGFATSALSRAFFPGGEPFTHARSEALNRLFQRWRLLGLVEFKRGRWHLMRGAWDKMQAQAIEARRAETGTGSVHESAVAKPCAPTPSPEG